MILVTIIVFVVILGLLIFVHEFGHFIAAKRAGMKVLEFGFGFPPRIFGIRKGETIYSINWIPLGGFVKILGEDGRSDDPGAFVNKGFWPRFKVLLAGVTMNIVLAWFLIFIAFAFVGAPLEVSDQAALSRASKVSEREIIVVSVQSGTPAEAAGLRGGDIILSLDGRKFVTTEEMIDYTKTKAGEQVTYQVRRGDNNFETKVVPRRDPPAGEGPVGFMPAAIANVTYPIFEAIRLSFAALVDRFWSILTAFGILIKGLLVSRKVAEGLAGPVGIAVLTRDFIQLGPSYLIQFVATLSINLAILNAVPFPALDGGRVLFLIIEKIRGVRSMKWEQIANAIGFLLLLLLMAVVTFNDIGRFSEQFRRLFDRLL